MKLFIKKKLQHRYIPLNIAKFLRTAFVMEHRWLLSTWPYYTLRMAYEFIAFSSYAMTKVRVSIITNLLRTNRYNRENGKQRCLLMILFLFLKVCSSYVFAVWKILLFLSLHINYIKFTWTTRRNSPVDQIGWKYTEQIRKQHRRIPLDFSQIFCFLL